MEDSKRSSVISSNTRSSSGKRILDLEKKLEARDLEISIFKNVNLELKNKVEEGKAELKRVNEKLCDKQKEIDFLQGNSNFYAFLTIILMIYTHALLSFPYSS